LYVNMNYFNVVQYLKLVIKVSSLI